jgi:[histone H3]-lysine27 N-trimethyltransferase EZH2
MPSQQTIFVKTDVPDENGSPGLLENDNPVPPPQKMCHNSQMMFSLGKRVSMGRSQTHGWGLYLREYAMKGDFIVEYRGELISEDEAERRGKLFDKLDMSFLFNLCEHVVVDATRKGSRAKFVNHSKEPNCHVRYKLVRGDHRIGLYAAKNLPAGTELSFDYLYSEDQAAWVMKSVKHKKNSSYLK